MRALLAVLLLLTLAFAGCASKGGGGGDDDPAGTGTSTESSSKSGTGSRSGTGTGSSTATSTGPGEGNQAPTATASVVVNGTSANFTLDGSDPDGDALSWELSFGDGSANLTGTALPHNATHTYVAGAYNATFVVSDGATATNKTIAVTVTGSGAATTQTFSSSYAIDNPACYGGPYDAYPSNASPSGEVAEFLSYASLTLDAGTLGQPFVVTFVSGAASDHILFLDAAGETISDTATGIPDDADWEITGTVPANAATAVFYGCQNLAGEGFDYTAGPGAS